MMRLFIADDSKLLRQRLVEMLDRVKGVDIIGEAGNAFDAVQAIERLKPDVVILDIRMPGGDGMLALEAIRKRGINSKIIMFTNYPYPQYKKRCLESGADYFITKSDDFEKIIGIVNELNQ